MLDALPVLVSYLDRHERYRYANIAYESWFQRPLSEVIGRTAAEMMPPAVYALHAPNIERVLAGEEVEYVLDVPYPSRVKHVRVRLMPDAPSGAVRGFFALIIDETEQTRAEAAALESEARLRSITGNLPSAMVYQMEVSPDGATRRFLYVADTCERLNGVPAEAALADSGALYGLIHPEDLPGMIAAEAGAIASGKPFDHTVRFTRPDGRLFWARLISARRERRDGWAIWDGVQIDVTDQRRAAERQKLLVNELNHRVKNTLAAVQSLVTQTARSHTDPAAFADALNGRLRALSRAQDLLTRTEWSGASLEDVASLTLAPHGDSAGWEGSTVALPAAAAVSWSLVLHELATNAAKYGAFSGDGQVALRWTTDDDRLTLEWRESGGPPVTAPAAQGFGTRLIDRTVRHELGGSAAFDFRPAGLVCRIETPLVSHSGETAP